jgi:thiamine-phosphate diphosphorylase
MAPAAVRDLVPPGFLVGRSVHSLEEAVAAAKAVDYLIAGTVWETSSKPALADSKLLGPEGLSQIVHAVRVPVLAIGGISVERVAEVRKSGAAGVAAIGLFMRSHQPGERPSCRAIPLIETVRLAGPEIDTPRRAS